MYNQDKKSVQKDYEASREEKQRMSRKIKS